MRFSTPLCQRSGEQCPTCGMDVIRTSAVVRIDGKAYCSSECVPANAEKAKRDKLVQAMKVFIRDTDRRHGRELSDSGEDYEETLTKRAEQRVDEGLRRADVERRKVVDGAVQLLRGTYVTAR